VKSAIKLAALAAISFGATFAAADTITFKNGDKLTGTVV